MTYNVSLMTKVRNQITANPESHDQDYYENDTECGTTRCIAGWTVFFARGTGRTVYAGGGSIFGEARDLLGLTDYEADTLFYEFGDAEAIARLDKFIEKGENQDG